jgi:hypothetical protein
VSRLPLPRLGTFQRFQRPCDGDHFARHELAALGVLVTFGKQGAERIRKALDDPDRHVPPAE